MKHIQKHGSISKAAKAMSLSYRKAWQMIRDLNALSGSPMVHVKLGGTKGGGAHVTEYGVQAMKKYFTIKEKAGSFFEHALKEVEL